MGTEYDSAKIRALARQISRAANAVSDVSTGPLRGVMREMPDNLKGSAATALKESVSDLMSDVNAISSHLSAVSNALNQLATRVDIADQQAKSIISSK